MTERDIRFHPLFYKDLEQLGTKELEIFYKKKTKIRKNPERQKHLSGGENCYREPITNNIRLIYYLHAGTIWFVVIGPHDGAYDQFRQRLRRIQESLEKR